MGRTNVKKREGANFVGCEKRKLQKLAALLGYASTALLSKLGKRSGSQWVVLASSRGRTPVLTEGSQWLVLS